MACNSWRPYAHIYLCPRRLRRGAVVYTGMALYSYGLCSYGRYNLWPIYGWPPYSHVGSRPRRRPRGLLSIASKCYINSTKVSARTRTLARALVVLVAVLP